jgi:hydrogenase maturation factor HypF (carbamoyltransferase family)
MNICTHCGARCAIVIDLKMDEAKFKLCFDCAATLAELLYYAVRQVDVLERGQVPERVM